MPRAYFPIPAARPVHAVLATAAAVLLTSVLLPSPATAEAPAPPGPAAHLLEADRLPSVAGAEWREVATGPEGAEPVGVCNRATLADVGALEVVRRAFGARTESGPARAVQLVAEFADATSAWRAREVLTAWGRDCEEWLRQPSARLGEVRPVAVTAGDAHAYAARLGKRRASAFGVVRHGRTLTVIHLAAPGEGTRVARVPARVAVKRIALTFAAAG